MKEKTKTMIIGVTLFAIMIISIGTIVSQIYKFELTEERFDKEVDECLYKYNDDRDSNFPYTYTNYFDCKLVDDNGKLIRNNFIKVYLKGTRQTTYSAVRELVFNIQKHYKLGEIEGIGFIITEDDNMELYITKKIIENTDWYAIKGWDDFYSKFEITTN